MQAEEYTNWLENAFQSQRFESFEVLDSLLDRAHIFKTIELKVVTNETLSIQLGGSFGTLSGPLAWSKLRMLLGKMGHYYLAQSSNGDSSAVYGFKGVYWHKIDSELFEYFVTSLNESPHLPMLRIEYSK